MSSRAQKTRKARAAAAAGIPSAPGGYEPRDVCWCGSQMSPEECDACQKPHEQREEDRS